MHKPSSGSTPAYRRIYNEIQARIESGNLKSGDRVESERQLAARSGVSLMTARHALKELELEGLVERRVGAGTFVAPTKVHFNRLQSFSEQMAARGVVSRSRVVTVQTVADEADVAARLGLAPGSRLIKLQRVRYGGGEPFAVETTFLSHDAYPRLVKSGRASLFETLEREYGAAPAYADEEVDATSADARTAEFLGVPRGAPVLRIRQVVFDERGHRLLYDVGVYRSDRHSLMIRRFR